jgi:hypothetical protein
MRGREKDALHQGYELGGENIQLPSHKGIASLEKLLSLRNAPTQDASRAWLLCPKLAPGQAKTDPNHGFRVCVNALVTKFLKPCASTIPLAADKITKPFN